MNSLAAPEKPQSKLYHEIITKLICLAGYCTNLNSKIHYAHCSRLYTILLETTVMYFWIIFYSTALYYTALHCVTLH